MHKIQYQKMRGQPNWCCVTALDANGRETSLSGYLQNINEVPGIDIEQNDKVSMIAEGLHFEVTYHWRNFKREWIQCDKSMYDWCKPKGIAVKIEFKYLSN